VDLEKLTEWANSRESGPMHKFTQILLDAIVDPDSQGA